MLTPSQRLSQLSRLFPGIWRDCDEIRSLRGCEGFPDWENQTFLPMQLWTKMILSRRGEQKVDCENGSQTVLLAAHGTWRPTQGIYSFAPALYDALLHTSVDDMLPADVLIRLPEWCLYIETPGVFHKNEELDGFFVHLDTDLKSNRIQLILLLCTTSDAFVPISFCISSRDTLDRTVSLHDALHQSMQQAKNYVSRNFQDPEIDSWVNDTERYDESVILQLLNLVLYLCSANPEMRDSQSSSTASHILPSPKRTRKGFRIFPPDKPTIWRIGENLSQQIEEAQSQTRIITAESGTHASPRPHIRRAHWHGFWSGPRKPAESTAESTRKFAVKWLPPMPVALTEEVLDGK